MCSRYPGSLTYDVLVGLEKFSCNERKVVKLVSLIKIILFVSRLFSILKLLSIIIFLNLFLFKDTLIRTILLNP